MTILSRNSHMTHPHRCTSQFTTLFGHTVQSMEYTACMNNAHRKVKLYNYLLLSTE